MAHCGLNAALAYMPLCVLVRAAKQVLLLIVKHAEPRMYLMCSVSSIGPAISLLVHFGLNAPLS